MSAADFTILERDELGNIKEMSVNNDDGEDNNDIDEDDDDAEYGAEARRSEQDNRLENITSMSESYSEILDSPVNSPTHEISEAIKGSPMRIPSRRPMNLQQTSGKSAFPNGSVSIDDDTNMTHFVADNLEYKIKIASPVSKRELSEFGASETTMESGKSPPESATAVVLQRPFLTSMPQVDANVLNDIEIEAQYLAANIDNITENLCNLLHSISSIAADNVETYKSAVNKLTDCMDANIKTMYTIMAKTEEIAKSLERTEQLASRIREIRRLVDMLDNAL